MSKLSLLAREINIKTHIIIPVTRIINLDQKEILDKTPFFFQPTNNTLDIEIAVLAPELQTYRLCVKRDFYKKCVNKSYNIFHLIDGYFTDIVIISSTIDISFNYSMTSKIPQHKYKLVIQALINWFSPANWWWMVYPPNSVGIICLTEDERYAFREYPNIIKGGLLEQIIKKLCKRIENLINYISINPQNTNNTTAHTINHTTDHNLNFWIKFCNPMVSIHPGSKIQPSTKSLLSGKDILNYLLQHTEFKKLCIQEYQGPANFLLFNMTPANPELCLSVFIRANKIIGFSQTNLHIGYIARLDKLITSYATQIINMTNIKWQELISNHDNQNNLLVEYEDVVLTIELLTEMTNVNNSELFINSIRIWDIEMGYGAWTNTGSKLFTWAELELLSGIPPVIKLIAKPPN